MILPAPCLVLKAKPRACLLGPPPLGFLYLSLRGAPWGSSVCLSGELPGAPLSVSPGSSLGFLCLSLQELPGAPLSVSLGSSLGLLCLSGELRRLVCEAQLSESGMNLGPILAQSQTSNATLGKGPLAASVFPTIKGGN